MPVGPIRNQAFKVLTFPIFSAKLKAPPNGLLRHTGECCENDQCRPRHFFFGVRILLGTILGPFSIIYFRGLGLRIRVMVWVMVRARVRVWVRVGVVVGVRVSVVLWSW